MKHIFFLLSFLFWGCFSFSQLTVKSGSFIYNNNDVVSVEQEINLDTLSNFYLRNKAQLVQKKSGVTSNTGDGILSVYQEGTSNQFVYNYWCSPVGDVSDADNKFGILQLNRPYTVKDSNPITLTSYNGSTTGPGDTGTLVVAKYWIWKYITSNGYNLGQPNGWIHVQDSTFLRPGEGFTMKGVSGNDITNPGEAIENNPENTLPDPTPFENNQRYDFRGKPNDGDITVGVEDLKFTLTGNPYPSAMDVSAFLRDPSNDACTGVAYYWEQDKTDSSHYLADYHGGYGTYVPLVAPYTGEYTAAPFDTYLGNGSLNTPGSSSGLIIERKYAPIGQGFMIEGNGTGTTVKLKNEYRDYIKQGSGLSEFERNASPSTNTIVTNQPVHAPQMRFDISLNNQYTRQIVLILIPQATDGVDRGIDAKSPADDALPNDVYFFLDNDKYVFEGVSFDVNKRIKVGVKSNPNVSFNFKLSHVVNFDQNQNVYIYDGLTQTYHDIKNGNYDVVLPGGIINDRFEITFTTVALNTIVNLEENFGIYQNNDFQTLTIENPTLLDVRSVSLFDVTGKIIFAKEKLGVENKYEFSTSNVSDGVYIVKLVTNNSQSLSHKIIVKNSKK